MMNSNDEINKESKDEMTSKSLTEILTILYVTIVVIVLFLKTMFD